jgi:hypothetical protein
MTPEKLPSSMTPSPVSGPWIHLSGCGLSVSR